jgi:ornithine cyclodeaminase
LYDIVKEVYIRHGQNFTVNPPSYFLRFPDKESSRIIALPALITQNPRISGIKWIASNPNNTKIGLKRASAVIILNDYETGYPVACLEGGLISALRTVYSAILVGDLLKQSERKEVIGVVGAGYIAEQFIRAICLNHWNISSIKLFDLDFKASEKLKKSIHKTLPTLKIEIVKALEEVITGSELTLLSTTSAQPYITEPCWFKHNPIVLNLSLRDLAAEILLCSNNVVDDIDHVIQANTSPHLAQKACGHLDFINCTVSQLINGYNQFARDKPIIFSPMGMGVLDLAVAAYVYEQAKKNNLGMEISNFFNTE